MDSFSIIFKGLFHDKTEAPRVKILGQKCKWNLKKHTGWLSPAAESALG
jgi:hypothetical protein